jgi:hypothetical protein
MTLTAAVIPRAAVLMTATSDSDESTAQIMSKTSYIPILPLCWLLLLSCWFQYFGCVG